MLRDYFGARAPRVLTIRNIFEHDRPVGLFNGDQIDWHSDGSWSTRPNLGSLTCCTEVPSEGGATWFAVAEQAYAELPCPLRRRLMTCQTVHSVDYLTKEQRRFNPISRRLVTRSAEFPAGRAATREALSGKGTPLSVRRLVQIHEFAGWRSP